MKILFTDLDDTLLNSDKNISKHTYSALIKMLSQGNKLVLASGRPVSSILEVKEKLNLPDENVYITAFNGALLYDCKAGKVLSEERVDLKLAQELYDKATAAGFHIHTYDENNNIISNHDDKELAYYRRHICGEAKITDRLADVMEKGPFKLLAISFDILDGDDKKQVNGGDAVSHGLDKFKKDFLVTELGSNFSCVFSHPTYLEFFSSNAGKGKGLIKLCDVLGIPVENSIAAGDAENDLSMIEAAGTGVCMSNGAPMLKEHADYITTNDQNHDGIAEVIERFILR